MGEVTLSGNEFILVTLLVKIAGMISLAALLVRSRFFRHALFPEEKGLREKLETIVFLGVPLSIGVLIRILMGYQAFDLSLAGTVLVGLLAGIGPGLAVGALVGLPGLISGELLALPAGLIWGLAGGLVRRLGPVRKELWQFSPFLFMNFVRFARRMWRSRSLDPQIITFGLPLGLEITRFITTRAFGQEVLWSLVPESQWVLLVSWLCTVSCVGIPLRIWNAVRVETKLQEQEAQLLRARFDALRSQINPHFLFNTLNTVASAIRVDPEGARLTVFKLASLLRRLLRLDEDFVTLREELDFIDSYLDIEVVRYGRDKLRLEKGIDGRALDTLVPSMILQPIVENAVKHGVAPRVGGGTIRLVAEREEAQTVILIEDDGPGIPEEERDEVLSFGIGISNVRERLRVVYGVGDGFRIEDRPGGGTRVILKIPARPPAPEEERTL